MPRLLLPSALLLAAAASALAAPPKLTVQLDWVAEPEHGAFYTAEALGYFKQEGLDVTLLQGGPNTYVQAKVATGQVQLGQDDSTNSLLAVQAGAPLVNIAAIFQHDPSVLMMQEACPVSDWKDLDGRTIMARPEWAFLPFLRDKYHIQFKVIPQNFDLGRLAVDPRFIQQGYYIAEPYFLEQKGIHLKFLKCWDSGFDAYATLITNRKYAAAHGAELRAFLRALQRGWKSYIEGDPGPAHALMLKINPKVTPGYLDWSRRQIIAAHLAQDEAGHYLTLTPERFQTEISQLENLKILEPGKVKVETAMDASFLPQ